MDLSSFQWIPEWISDAVVWRSTRRQAPQVRKELPDMVSSATLALDAARSDGDMSAVLVYIFLQQNYDA